MKRDMFYV